MNASYHILFGHMCDFHREPPLLFYVPDVETDIFYRASETRSPVELVVPDLDAFCVPEEDLERIQWAVDAAFEWEGDPATEWE